MTGHRVLALATAALALAAIAPAVAQPTRPAAATSTDAQELYRQGAAAYQAADYDRAIALFERAQALAPSAVILFNLGQAHRLAGRCGDALRSYDQALQADPDPPNRTELLERITEMQRCAREEETARPKPPPIVVYAPAPPAPPTRRRPAGGRWLAIVGAAVATVGGGLYGAARIRLGQVRDRCPCAPGSFDGWRATTTASYALIAVGATGATVGLSWWLFGPITTEPGEHRATGVALSGRF